LGDGNLIRRPAVSNFGQRFSNLLAYLVPRTGPCARTEEKSIHIQALGFQQWNYPVVYRRVIGSRAGHLHVLITQERFHHAFFESPMSSCRA
jgi:hypothetical protein